MSYRGSPLHVMDYIRQMDAEIRDLRANAGTTRVPSQRIGGYIIEVDDSSGDPLIKMTEVATGTVTYCCIPQDTTDCFEIPPFSWFGLVDVPDVFPAYPMPRDVTIVEAAVLQGVSDSLELQILVNSVSMRTIDLTPGVKIYPISPLLLHTNDEVTISVTVAGSAEDVTIVLRSCAT